MSGMFPACYASEVRPLSDAHCAARLGWRDARHRAELSRRTTRPAQDRSGSIGRLGRRVAALVIDYAAATIIATAFFGFRQFDLPKEAGGLTQFAR